MMVSYIWDTATGNRLTTLNEHKGWRKQDGNTPLTEVNIDK
jgi:hypothetical protein